MKDIDDKLDEILTAYYHKTVRVDGNTPNSRSEAKQAIKQLITEARIDEAKYARSRLLKVGSFEHKLQTERIKELEGKE